MNRPIRVGAVSYLNTKPLVEGLHAESPEIDLSFALPSRIADQFHQGKIDVGLIPVVEYFQNEEYRHVPDVAIACRGPVLSVTLFSRVPWGQIRSIALDVGSRTSAALTKILAGQKYQTNPEYISLPLNTQPESLMTDAVLLIGDRALKACLPSYQYAYDMGEEWQNWTNLPFVFALWAVRPEVAVDEITPALQRAKHLGMKRVGWIAAREAEHLSIDPGFCRRYLSNIIRYDLGRDELAGMNLFRILAVEQGLVSGGKSNEPEYRHDLVQSR